MAIVGYLANVFNIPPLVFRFQIPPDLLSEKSRYGYTPSQGMGKWKFDQTDAAVGAIGTITGLLEDLKEMGSLLTNTKALAPSEGEPRVFELEFHLYAGRLPDNAPSPDSEIEQYLALLRAFMVPGVDIFSAVKDIVSLSPPCLNKPPEVSFKYGPISATCVMTDLNIKILSFNGDGTAQHAQVNTTLKEQTHAIAPIVESVKRTVTIFADMGRDGYAEDLLIATPGVGAIAELFL
ncbi:MAG TPA: hypothetical protein VGJ86_10470 [Acidimicrobiales bacterium]|jgi:hypothetical protein